MSPRTLATLLAGLAGCATPARGPSPSLAPNVPVSLAPPVTPIAEQLLPVPQELVLPNGLRVVFLERHDVPSLSLRLVLLRSSLDLGDPGAIRVGQMGFLYSQGGDEAYRALATEAELHGVGIRETPWADWIGWSSHAPAPELDRAVQLLARRSFGAQLTEQEYHRREQEWLASESGQRRIPLAAERFVLFGPSHPDGYAGWGDRLLTRVEAIAVRASLLQANRAILVVVGDAQLGEVTAAARRWFGQLPVGPSTAEPPPGPKADADHVPSRIVFVAGGGLQEYGSIVARGPVPTAEEVAALQVVRQLLGGWGSMVNEEVRDEMGATYGVGVRLIRQRSSSWMVIGGRYQQTKVLDALVAELGVVEQLRQGKVTPAALTEAREMTLGEWRGAMASVDGMADSYALTLGCGDSIDRLAELPLRLNRVESKDLRQAVGRFLDPARLHIVLVGATVPLDPKAGLQALGATTIDTVRLPR